MIPQTNEYNKKNTCKNNVVQHLKVRRELKFGNFKERGERRKTKKKYFWGFTPFGRYSLGRGSQIGCQDFTKIFTSHTLIFTFYRF